jgi:ribosomal protein L29
MMKELAKKTDKELKELLAEKREFVRSFRFGMAGSATRDTKAGKNAKHDVARIMTELSRRTLALKAAPKAITA